MQERLDSLACWTEARVSFLGVEDAQQDPRAGGVNIALDSFERAL